MTDFSGEIVDTIGISQPPTAVGYGANLADRVGLRAAFGSTGLGKVMVENLGLDAQGPVFHYHPGAIITEKFGLHSALVSQGLYSQELIQAIRLVDQLTRGIQADLTDGIGYHHVLAVARAVVVLQGLRIHDQFDINHNFQVEVDDALGLLDALINFFGLEPPPTTLGMHDTFIPTFQFAKALIQGLGLNSTLLSNMLFLRVVEETVDFEDTQILNMIYQGDVLVSGLGLSIGTIDPGGGFTSWAINTRTSAVTEYQNWNFNSFCQIGNQVYGANENGLWLLNAQTDDGANIVTDIKGAMLSLGGSRFTQLDGVYLGMRVDDDARDFILKLIVPNAGITGADAVYLYKFNPRNMRTTKINIGKGLRARYIQWELITPGPDFDLDSIEFVPVISKRRV